MNRSNVGNIITNGMQVLSVAGTTFSGYVRGARREDAASRLTQQREDRANQLFELQKEGLQAKNAALQSKADIASQKLETEKLKTEKSKLDIERKQQIVDKNKNLSVDQAVLGAKEIYKDNGEQVKYISSNTDFNVNYLEDFLNKYKTEIKDLGYVFSKKGEGGKFVKRNIEKESE